MNVSPQEIADAISDDQSLVDRLIDETESRIESLREQAADAGGLIFAGVRVTRIGPNVSLRYLKRQIVVLQTWLDCLKESRQANKTIERNYPILKGKNHA